MRIVQYIEADGRRRVAVVSDHPTELVENTTGEDAWLQPLQGAESVRELALQAHREGTGLAALIGNMAKDEAVDYAATLAEGRVLLPLDHPDPAHLIVSGTGLDHLGSAQARDAMHTKLNAGEEELTDSMRMFKLGLEGGKPPAGEVGVQPEWFYKGDGTWLVAPGSDLELPPFAYDGSEEPELVGLYVIGDGGEVLRVGFAIGNEYSDHILERQNYLYLAHSKLRTSSFGPELRIGDPPAHIQGISRILRDGQELWRGDFLTGEDNMTHSIANIEHHHFKYDRFRRPGDVHCHYYGTATLSFAAGVTTQPGDIFEISAPEFGRPLRNTLAQMAGEETLTPIHTL